MMWILSYAIAVFALGGCTIIASSGELRAESLGREAAVLNAPNVAAVYSHGIAPETSIFLMDVSLQSLLNDPAITAQVVHLELLWDPKPGRTPIDADATNASIRYVVMVGEEVGVYGGAGFVVPHGKPGRERLSITVKNASLTLLESTPGFVDRLGPAQLTGRFTALRDDSAATRVRYAVSQRVTDALGRTLMVDTFSIGDHLATMARQR